MQCTAIDVHQGFRVILVVVDTLYMCMRHTNQCCRHVALFTLPRDVRCPSRDINRPLTSPHAKIHRQVGGHNGTSIYILYLINESCEYVFRIKHPHVIAHGNATADSTHTKLIYKEISLTCNHVHIHENARKL
jgi:hypothetical protein